jgi:dTDP-4-amino-4,6-dideoxygalactose transaminase
MAKTYKIPFGTISITEKSKQLVNDALNTNRVSSGKYVKEFERRFADIVGAHYAVAVSSGTDALIAALMVLYDFGARRGDEIILPALSFVATGNAVLNAGFKPVFVDIDRTTLNIDVANIEKAITGHTRAILPVHLMGKPANMDAINAIARKHGLIVIEDAAEAHGLEYHGKRAGNLADLSAFSLYVAHIISTVEGGIVTTNNSTYAEVLRSLRSHGRACKCEQCQLNVGSAHCPKRFHGEGDDDIRFFFERVGFSCKMNELEAAVGLGYVDMYEKIVQKRRANLLHFLDNVNRFSPYICSISETVDEKIGPHAIPMIIQDGAPFSRAEFSKYLESQGIETRTLFSSIPTQCPGFLYLGHTLGEFPNAEFIGKNGVHIGVHQNLEKSDIDYVLDKVDAFLKKKN